MVEVISSAILGIAAGIPLALLITDRKRRKRAQQTSRMLRRSHIGTFGWIGFLFSGILTLLALAAAVLLALKGSASLPLAITILAGLSTASAWTIKNTKDSLEKRAYLLVIEHLSHRPMTRAELKKAIYGDSFLFSLSPSTYIDILADLYAADRIFHSQGVYSLVTREDGDG